MEKIANYPRILYLGEGILSSILGLCALLLPQLFTFTMEQFIGWLSVFLGVAQFYHLLRIYHRREFWSMLSISLLHIIIGALLIRYPVAGIQSLTLWITTQFIISGLVKFILAYQIYPQRGWEWFLAGGIVSWVAVVIILLNWPVAAFWLLGFLSGLNFLVYGLFQMAFGLRGTEFKDFNKN